MGNAIQESDIGQVVRMIEDSAETFWPSIQSLQAIRISTVSKDYFAVLPKGAEGVSENRLQQFLAGRACAQQALMREGCQSGILQIDQEGVPIWPEEYLGSISHSRGIAVASAGRSSGARIVGIDLERTDRLSSRAAKRVVHEYEESFVGDSQVNASIIFSLKEAFYKAQYPMFRTRANFHDLALSIDETTQLATADWMAGSLDSSLRNCRLGYKVFQRYVLSYCWLPNQA